MNQSCFLAALLTCWLFCAQSNGQEQANVLLITNARIVDVRNGEVSPPTDVLIRGNRIARIARPPLESPEAAIQSVDAGGGFMIPGLIDLHSHLLLHPYNEASWNDQVLKESLEFRVIRGTIHAKQNLEAGFTTIRELGTEGAAFADVAIRDAINQGLVPGPRIFTATRALVTSGGYGPSGFDPRFDLPKGAQVADGIGGVRKATREQIAAGADWIKVYADYRRKSGDRSTPTFSLDELRAIVDEAKSAGLSVSAHATTDRGIRRAVEAGVRTIEHGYEASVDTLKLMRDNNVYLCPTLAASEAMAIYGGWTPDQPDHPRIKLARQLMKNVIESGVTVACGSDVGVFAHGSNVRELELMFAYGMSAAHVLKASTITAAEVLEKDNELGRVAENYLADLVIVENNPLEDLATLRKPSFVIKNGVIAFARH